MAEMVEARLAEREESVQARLVHEFVIAVISVSPAEWLLLEPAAHADHHQRDQRRHLPEIGEKAKCFSRRRWENTPHQAEQTQAPQSSEQRAEQHVADDRVVVPDHPDDDLGLIEILKRELVVARLKLAE